MPGRKFAGAIRGLLCMGILVLCIVLLMLAMADFQYARRDFSSLNAIGSPSDAPAPPTPPGSVAVIHGQCTSSLTVPPMGGGD